MKKKLTDSLEINDFEIRIHNNVPRLSFAP